MKKSLKKLTLSRETISLLGSGQLLGVAGAASGDGEFNSRCGPCAPDTWTSVKNCM